MSEIRVNGLAELQALLNTLPAKIEANILRGALRAGAKPIMQMARESAPVGEPSEANKRKYNLYKGALRDSLRISARIDRRSGDVIASVKAGGKSRKTGADVFYAHIVEYTGAAPHGNHPGMMARPFMRNALDAQSESAVVAAAEYIKKRLSTKHGLDTADIDIDALEE